VGPSLAHFGFLLLILVDFLDGFWLIFQIFVDSSSRAEENPRNPFSWFPGALLIFSFRAYHIIEFFVSSCPKLSHLISYLLIFSFFPSVSIHPTGFFPSSFFCWSYHITELLVLSRPICYYLLRNTSNFLVFLSVLSSFFWQSYHITASFVPFCSFLYHLLPALLVDAPAGRFFGFVTEAEAMYWRKSGKGQWKVLRKIITLEGKQRTNNEFINLDICKVLYLEWMYCW